MYKPFKHDKDNPDPLAKLHDLVAKPVMHILNALKKQQSLQDKGQKGQQWNLGKLPHATKEAEWVSHILKWNPILHEQATKDAVMLRIMNTKVIHLATHKSAVAAFAGMTASTIRVNDKRVFIYPEEIESLNISPALVVLSSCDSRRGVFKLDSIQGVTEIKLQFTVYQCTVGDEKCVSQQSHYSINERKYSERQNPACHNNGAGFSQGKSAGAIKEHLLYLSSSENCKYSSECSSENSEEVKSTQRRKKCAGSGRKRYIRKHQRKQTENRIKETRISSSDMTDGDISVTEYHSGFNSSNESTSEKLKKPQQCKDEEQEISTTEQSACCFSAQLLNKKRSQLVIMQNYLSVPSQIVDYFNQVTVTSQANIFICLYYDQGRFYGKLISPNKFACQCELLSKENIPTINVIAQNLLNFSLCANGHQKVVIVLDDQTDLRTHTVIGDLQAKWIDSYNFQTVHFPPGVFDPDLPVIAPPLFKLQPCVVGNPTIPPTIINGNEKIFPALPHATKEAKWVSHILKCVPILHENATKSFIMRKMQNARLIHFATHRSGDEGYLAFSYNPSNQSTKNCFLTPQEIAKLMFNEPPVLVVLSICVSAKTSYGSGRIEGMTRAFHQAGAQAVISTNSEVWDDSSLTFMQFLYQYLIVNGMTGTQAVRKTMLSMRCFTEFSDPRHWSCYQYSGREIQFAPSPASSQLTSHLEPPSVFPRLECVKCLECALLSNPTLPTDVQVCVCTFVHVILDIVQIIIYIACTCIQ